LVFDIYMNKQQKQKILKAAIGSFENSEQIGCNSIFMAPWFLFILVVNFGLNSISCF